MKDRDEIRRLTFARKPIEVGVFCLAISVIAIVAMHVGFAYVPVRTTATAMALLGVLGAGTLYFGVFRTMRGVIFDLTERNRLLRMTEENANVGHWRVDFNTDELFWSDQTYKIYGLSKSEKPNLQIAIDAFHHEDRYLIEDAVETARETGKPYTVKARLRRPDGSIRYTEVVARVELDGAGNPAAIFGIFADRTEETLLNEELIEARNEAEASGAAKASFLAKMSHEIRTPMNGIVGFADLLLQEEMKTSQRRMVELIAESGKSLTLLLNDILDLSKIEAGETVIRKESTDVGHIARQVAKLFEPQAREKGVELRVNVAPDVPINLMGDGLRLRQILSNLLGNAIKFTERGFVEIRVEVIAGQLHCKVIDTGIGISEDAQRKVFEPFTQSDGTVEERYGGTGLGLAICRQLTTLMGGLLELESTEGEGSMFDMILPIEYAALRGPAAATRPSAPMAGNQRILLAEDYDINQHLIAGMAKNAGIELDIAEDGEAALRMVCDAQAQDCQYAAVLMDVQMPVMDGIEATRKIRALGIDGHTLPIIALSANAYPDDIEECLAAGMQSHMAKPLSYDTFTNEVGRWLTRSSMAA
ncbi:PAS domain-containing hybrid sensor histidine kinase/response regulator [Aurantiacibacter rhizosphaerae]|uniref:histidine kinase n=1 Tax=Aurantiacibacter rhizosphaerae TaxID=2691582 RepID=A0A844XAV4_9SPHN|nr:PAS domain-containing hybrid sensor histidine kinase/response regulator [Aurantiacibacter rhizosphaerae]MWV26909.1 response regulator [Aurantiacibacter rhizosphaerae]